MRVLLVGAGAVGSLFYRAIEQTKGNELTFLVRAGRKRTLERLKLVDARTGQMRVRERPAAVELGQVRPTFDTVLFCVRGDQLAAALDDVGAVPTGCRLATITPGADGLQLLHTRHPGCPAVRIAPALMAYLDDDAVVSWSPPLVKTVVAGDEGDAQAAAFAEELAAALTTGGVPATARARMVAGIDAGTDATTPLLAAYALAGYDADVLARDRELLALTAGAVGEAMTIAGAPAIAATLARLAVGPMVRAALTTAAPRMPETFRAMWRAHAPKIDAQTRAMLGELTRRAATLGRDAPSLDELARRLEASAATSAAPPPPVAAPLAEHP